VETELPLRSIHNSALVACCLQQAVEQRQVKHFVQLLKFGLQHFWKSSMCFLELDTLQSQYTLTTVTLFRWCKTYAEKHDL